MSTRMQRPRRLSAGDRIAAVTLSWGGPGAFPHRYEAGKRQLENAFGVQVVEMLHRLADPDVLAADPASRVADLHAAFADPDIAGVVSTIGGDDSIRLLPLIDLDLLAANPKVFLGYSDATITQRSVWVRRWWRVSKCLTGSAAATGGRTWTGRCCCWRPPM